MKSVRNTSQTLLQQVRQHQREVLRTLGPAGVITLLGFVVAFFFIEPAPPRTLVIATGPKDGVYYETGVAYARFLESKGIKIVVRETAGSIENFRLLNEDNDIDLAIVQAGAKQDSIPSDNLEALASLYLEPIWIFHRTDLEPNRLSDFSGKVISAGQAESGTHALIKLLFKANGIASDGAAGAVTLVNEDTSTGIERLRSGEIDALAAVVSPESELVAGLLSDPSLKAFSFQRQEAYARRFSFLEAITLEKGVVDLGEDIPREPVKLVGPYANLVANQKFHDALIPPLLEAATNQHYAGGLLSNAGDLPSLNGSEFPISEIARDYLTHGPSLFQRHMNFWVASLIDRVKIMLIPLVALLFPLVKLAPPVYRWRMRSRIYNWYTILQGVEKDLRDGKINDLSHYLEQLSGMEQELAELEVPLSYMQELYNLQLHIDLVRRRLNAEST